MIIHEAMMRNKKLNKQKIGLILVVLLVVNIFGCSEIVDSYSNQSNYVPTDFLTDYTIPDDYALASSTVANGSESDQRLEPMYMYAINTTQTPTASINPERPPINQFDYSTNTKMIIGGYTFSIPLYWSSVYAETNNVITEHYRAYAETGGKVAMIEFSVEKTGYRTTLNELKSLVLDGSIISNFCQGFDEVYTTTYDAYAHSTLNGYIYEITFRNEGIDAYGLVLIVPTLDNDGYLYACLAETDNTAYTYEDDFRKILNSALGNYNLPVSSVAEADTQTEHITQPVAPTPAVPTYNFVLNTNSMKAHLPTCGAVSQIRDYNRLDYTGTIEDLIRAGYEPCGRCHPW